MEISVVIVDDNILNASELEEIVESYDSLYNSEGVSYKVIRKFTGVHAFNSAYNYILSNQNEIDILLVDYNLLNGKGTDLFRLVKKEYKIYKILHSETDASLVNSKSELIGNLFNDFCPFKNAQTIHEALFKYEKEILDIKLNGNKKFRDKRFVNRAKLEKMIDVPSFGGVMLFDIICAKSIGVKDQITIYFRDYKNEKIDQLTRSTERLTFFSESPFYFKHISHQMVLNLLWVANINTHKRKINFITLNNSTVDIDYSPTNKFKTDIKPYLLDIEEGIPTFLKC